MDQAQRVDEPRMRIANTFLLDVERVMLLPVRIENLEAPELAGVVNELKVEILVGT